MENNPNFESFNSVLPSHRAYSSERLEAEPETEPLVKDIRVVALN